jgi:PAS domain S-box-containing protein
MDKGTRKVSASAGAFLFFAVVALGVVVGLAGYSEHRRHTNALEKAFLGRVEATLQGLEGQSGNFIATFDYPLVEELQKRTVSNLFVVGLSIENHLAHLITGTLPADPPPGAKRFYRDIIEAGEGVGRIVIDVDSGPHERVLAGVTRDAVITVVIVVLLASGLLFAFIRLGMEREMASAQREETEARRELEKSNRLFRTLIDGSSLGIYVHRYFKPIYANKSLLELVDLGSHEEFLALDSTLSFLHPGEHQRVSSYHEARLHGQPAPNDYELKLLSKNSRTKWVSNRSFPIDWEDEPAVCTTFLDITERRKAEAELREAHGNIQEVLEASPAGFAISRPEDGCIEFANSQLAAMNGVPLERFVGSYSRDFYHDPDERAEIIEEFRREGSVTNRQVHFRRADGSTFWGLMTLQPTTYLGKPRLFAWIHDVTELKEALEAAEAAARAKSAFLSSMSHELRTPLNAILGFAQLLQSGKKNPLSDRQKEQVQYIKGGGDRLLEMVDEILDLEKIETGDMPLMVEPVDGRILLDSCLSHAESLAARRGIAIEDRTEKSMPEILADPVRSKQAIDNLFSNAVKFNREGGTVWLDAERRDHRVLRVSVTDTGPGIPEDRQPDLFQPFSRLGMENTEIEGTGIGLALTKKLVEEMGGTIGLESSPEKGSTFWIEFPLAKKKGTGESS